MPQTISGDSPSSAADVSLPDAPASAVADDLRAFVRTEHLARPSSARAAVHVLVVLLAWVALATVGTAADSWVVWIPVWVGMTALTATPIALMHEAVHQNLFRSRVANHVTGTVAAAWMFFHGPAYRAWHLTHHAYTFTPDDSEQLPDRFRSRLGYLGYSAVLGPSFAVILWFGAIATLVGKPPRWVGPPRLRRYVRRWALAPVVVFGVLAAAAVTWPELIVKGWLVPAVLGSVVLFPFLTLPEHYEGKGSPTLYGNTRTTVSNRLQRYLYWNNNLHTAHHLVPTVPPHQLGRVDERIAEANTLRDRGFLAFHHRILRALPWLPPRDASPRQPAEPGVNPVQESTTMAPEPMVPPGVSMTISNRVDPALLPRLWEIYASAFEPLQDKALLCHLYPRHVFEQLVLDERVFKIIGWADGEPVGLAAATNHLELVPQISPPFLARRYPEHAARHAIYFGIWVCVDANVRSTTVTARLIAGMGQVAALRGGVIICDVSQHNCDLGVDRMVGRVVDWFPEGAFDRIDSQHYYACMLPEPLERLPFSKAPMPTPTIDLRTPEELPAPAAVESDQSVPTTER